MTRRQLETVTHNLHEVDEDLIADELSQRSLDDGMPACHGFKRRALGVVVVVDVHAWMGRSPITDVLDELDSISFLDLVMRPKRIELPVAACVAGDPPKQEEEVGVGAPERVAFEIEEDVSIIGLRQCLEPVSSLIGDPEDLEWRELIGTFAGFYLQPGLGLDRGQPLGTQPIDRLRAL